MGKPKIFCQAGIGLVIFVCFFVWNGASAAYRQIELTPNFKLRTEAANAFYPNGLPASPATATQTSGCLSLVPQQKLTIPLNFTPTYETSIAVSGDTMAVGAPSNTVGNVARQGSVNVFVRTGSTWTLQQEVTAPGGAFDDRFGISVALSGNTLVVGASLANIGSNADQGAAYVFQRNGTAWGFVQKLVAFDGFRFENFGFSVAIDSGTIVVGSPNDQNNDTSVVGSAYVYVLNGGWTFQQKLAISSFSYFGNGYGSSVKVSGDTVLIGAPGAEIIPNTNQGAGYVWVRNGATWTLQQQLVAPNGAMGEFFASSIDLAGDTAILSRASATVGANAGQGAAYVFARSGGTWAVQQVLTAENGKAGDGFSSKLALSGNSLVVYAPNANTFSFDRGWLYLFQLNGTVWTELQSFTNTDGSGLSGELAFNNGTAVIGSANQVQAYACSSCPAIKVQPSTFPYATTNTFYSQALTATGGQAPYAFMLVSGELPQGLTLTQNGVVSGTVTAAAHSLFIFTIRITDVNGCSMLRTYAITAVPPCTPLLFNPTTLPDKYANEVASQQFQITGGTPNYTFTLAGGSLPPGISLFNSGSLYGYPSTAGIYNFTIQATDRYGCVGTHDYSWRILPPCSVITIGPIANLPTAIPGQFYSQTLTQSGAVAPVTWEVTNNLLAPGLRFDPVTSTISGVPQQKSNFDSFSTLGVLVRDANNCIATRNFEFVVHPTTCIPVKVYPIALEGGVTGSPYFRSISVDTNGIYDLALTSGVLPQGLSFGSGAISGTPAPNSQGNYTFTLTATDSKGCAGSNTYMLNIADCAVGSISPTGQAVSNGGGDFSLNVTAQGCSWSVKSHSSWITILSYANATGNGSVNYRVAVNPGIERQGAITINDRIFYVTQSAGDSLADYDLDGIPNGVELGESTNPAVKDNDIFTNTWQNDRLFVMQQYRDFLGREADLTGANNWTNALYGNSLTRAQAVESFFNSSEFQGNAAPVVRLYFGAFLRIPDYEGLTNWMNAYRAGMPITTVAQAFATSPEFLLTYGALDNTQFVTLLYNNILGRAPDQAGLNGWVNLLNNGTSRGAVLVGFSESQEYIASSGNKVFVTMIYVGTLRRSPDVGGFNNWLGYLVGGNSRLNMIQGFISSQEYHNRFLP